MPNTIKISKRTVDKAAGDPSKRLIYWDEALKGFGLLVLPSGVKSYLFNYRNRYGRERRITIGKHGKWTADQARDQAHNFQRAVAEGRDPLDEKKSDQSEITVNQLFDRYLESGSFAAKAPSTQAIDKGRLNQHLRPLIGRRPLKALTIADVEKAHKQIRDGKTAKDEKSTKKRGRIKVTGGSGTARMAIRLLRAILSWGVRNQLVMENVAKYVEIGRDGRRSIIIDDVESYKRLFETLDSMERALKIRAAVADAIRLIALTGARRGEIANLKWRHVDFQSATLTLTASEHKSGRTTGDDRVIGLPVEGVEVIKRQPQRGPDDYVFAPARGEGPVDLSKPWRLVRAKASLPDNIGLHSLRHSLASHMAMAGAAAPEIQQVLGHRDITTSSRYVHWANSQRQAIAEKAAASVSAALRSASNVNESQKDD